MAYATRQLHRMRGFGLLDYQNALILLRPLNGEFDPFGYFRHFISFFQGNLSLYYFLTFYYFYEKKQTNK